MNIVEQLLENADTLRKKANEIIPRLIKNSSKIEFAYNPLEYAWSPHSEYIRRHGGMGAKILLVGMNPGHGMGTPGHCIVTLIQSPSLGFGTRPVPCPLMGVVRAWPPTTKPQ